MPIRQFKPVTKSSRFRSVADFTEITRTTPEKSLLEPLKKSGGRDNHGHIAMRRIGGGHKRKYRIIDFKRNRLGQPATVREIEYDPNRSARIALVQYEDGEKRYILHPKGLKVGDVIASGPGTDVRLGQRAAAGRDPARHRGAQHRAQGRQGRADLPLGGMSAQVMAKEGEYVTLRMPSSEVRLVHQRCLATIGEVGNAEHELESWGKAGKSRWMGKRPKVRGEVMNPVDHPHGGRTRGGRNVVSPWGKKEGVKTRNKKKPSQRMIVRGRKRGKATQ
jgi:large subunit ribosomal protein L2